MRKVGHLVESRVRAKLEGEICTAEGRREAVRGREMAAVIAMMMFEFDSALLSPAVVFCCMCITDDLGLTCYSARLHIWAGRNPYKKIY